MESWQAFFGRQAVTAASSFAGLGGDSLSYVSAYLSLEDTLGEVPDNWTTMTIAELAATAQPAGAKRSALVTIESAILMRAVAICVVVGSHFQLFFSGGAGTSALLWVSGSIFGALQLREMDHDGRPRADRATAEEHPAPALPDRAAAVPGQAGAARPRPALQRAADHRPAGLHRPAELRPGRLRRPRVPALVHPRRRPHPHRLRRAAGGRPLRPAARAARPRPRRSAPSRSVWSAASAAGALPARASGRTRWTRCPTSTTRRPRTWPPSRWRRSRA